MPPCPCSGRFGQQRAATPSVPYHVRSGCSCLWPGHGLALACLSPPVMLVSDRVARLQAPSGAITGRTVTMYISDSDGDEFTEACLPINLEDDGYNMVGARAFPGPAVEPASHVQAPPLLLPMCTRRSAHMTATAPLCWLTTPRRAAGDPPQTPPSATPTRRHTTPASSPSGEVVSALQPRFGSRAARLCLGCVL